MLSDVEAKQGGRWEWGKSGWRWEQGAEAEKGWEREREGEGVDVGVVDWKDAVDTDGLENVQQT